MSDNPEGCDGHCDTCSSKTDSCQKPKKADISVKHVILVLSGKGGVGKSTVSVNLAYALSNHGYQTGLLDLDIHGPSIAKMLGIEDLRLQGIGNKIMPIKVTGSIKVISMALLLNETDSPVVWRGPMKAAAIQQFLGDVDWGDLDYLVCDLPPGTGDEALNIVQYAPNVEGAVIVTTPQDVAVLDSTKAIKFIEMMELPVLGIVENMSGLICPHCGEVLDVFGQGGGKKAADKYNVPFLGSIPLDIDMRRAGDEGRPFILKSPGQKGGEATREAVDKVMENLIAEVEKRE
ncbi:MAG TPA: Mrp/NBP35 family ATP-binding protein [Methanocorpusculum sp.]|nr:Mrp/NBP35 family ATP-binding protein [Candidatus Methanocorpusculum equi]MCQ2357460.1 Mrp/NBP35 family ATP-binding protein [Methanocorpusculum sp.]HJJ33198.1 Mrp/NBP35 family ATP-binding protein [Methanocorpusculum sp.]HJJ44303.1 Mrp/NBP35 family ATP-binding protein [Methanocorpusculum sp.]HJJ58029.1 Mrp/NBP35 family ATP-binding protein [Methanocorpusculum sp.]